MGVITMQAVLDLLYRDAMEHIGDTLRMLDSDELGHYQECAEVLPRQEEELASILGRERLKWYTDLREEQDFFFQQALFRRGLALGLRLGALAIQ